MENIKDFDYEGYRKNLASELVKEQNHKKRQRILRRAKTSNEYGLAVQLRSKEKGVELSGERASLYESLSEKIGNTPLVRYEGEVPNGNRIFLKLECENPFGNNHYDRVYLKLFHEKEELGLIKPGDNVFETSSGSAGISFSAIGRELGYICHVAIPAGGEKAREEATLAKGAKVYLTPEDEYVNGFQAFIPRFMKEHPDYIFINHSMGNILGKGSEVNENAIASMEDIAEEVIEQLTEVGEDHPDYLLSAVGNGTNTFGIGRKMKEISPETKLIGYESFSSAAMFRMKKPAQYEEIFDVDNEGVVKPENFERHSMPGTTFPGKLINMMPSLKESALILDDVVLVADEKIMNNYQNLAGIPDRPNEVVMIDEEGVKNSIPDLGRSTRAGASVALNIANKEKDKLIIVIAYDKADRYDSK